MKQCCCPLWTVVALALTAAIVIDNFGKGILVEAEHHNYHHRHNKRKNRNVTCHIIKDDILWKERQQQGKAAPTLAAGTTRLNAPPAYTATTSTGCDYTCVTRRDDRGYQEAFSITLSCNFFREHGIVTGQEHLGARFVIPGGSILEETWSVHVPNEDQIQKVDADENSSPSLAGTSATNQGRRQHPQRRRLDLRLGERTLLAVRLTTTFGEEPVESIEEIRGALFGGDDDAGNGNFTPAASVVDQFAAMSHGQVRFMPATGPNVQLGVAEVVVDHNLTGADIQSSIRSIILNATKRVVTATNNGTTTNKTLEEVADFVVFCLPAGGQVWGSKSFLAFTQYPAPYSYYQQGRCSKLSFVIHELGHSLGLQHSGVGSDEYADTSGYMGYSEDKFGVPRKALNPHKHWVTGWFRDRQVRLNLNLKSPLRGHLVSFVDYGHSNLTDGDVVLIRLGQHLYMHYNKAKGYNIETWSATKNAVTVVRAENDASTSTLVASLTAGEIHRHTTPETLHDLVIQVCETETTPEGIDYATISIHVDDGAQKSQCNASLSSSMEDDPIVPPPMVAPGSFSPVNAVSLTQAPTTLASSIPPSMITATTTAAAPQPSNPPSSSPTMARRIVTPPRPIPAPQDTVVAPSPPAPAWSAPSEHVSDHEATTDGAVVTAQSSQPNSKSNNLRGKEDSATNDENPSGFVQKLFNGVSGMILGAVLGLIGLVLVAFCAFALCSRKVHRKPRAKQKQKAEQELIAASTSNRTLPAMCGSDDDDDDDDDIDDDSDLEAARMDVNKGTLTTTSEEEPTTGSQTAREPDAVPLPITEEDDSSCPVPVSDKHRLLKSRSCSSIGQAASTSADCLPKAKASVLQKSSSSSNIRDLSTGTRKYRRGRKREARSQTDKAKSPSATELDTLPVEIAEEKDSSCPATARNTQRLLKSNSCSSIIRAEEKRGDQAASANADCSQQAKASVLQKSKSSSNISALSTENKTYTCSRKGTKVPSTPPNTNTNKDARRRRSRRKAATPATANCYSAEPKKKTPLVRTHSDHVSDHSGRSASAQPPALVRSSSHDCALSADMTLADQKGNLASFTQRRKPKKNADQESPLSRDPSWKESSNLHLDKPQEQVPSPPPKTHTNKDAGRRHSRKTAAPPAAADCESAKRKRRTPLVRTHSDHVSDHSGRLAGSSTTTNGGHQYVIVQPSRLVRSSSHDLIRLPEATITAAADCLMQDEKEGQKATGMTSDSEDDSGNDKDKICPPRNEEENTNRKMRRGDNKRSNRARRSSNAPLDEPLERVPPSPPPPNTNTNKDALRRHSRRKAAPLAAADCYSAKTKRRTPLERTHSDHVSDHSGRLAGSRTSSTNGGHHLTAQPSPLVRSSNHDLIRLPEAIVTASADRLQVAKEGQNATTGMTTSDSEDNNKKSNTKRRMRRDDNKTSNRPGSAPGSSSGSRPSSWRDNPELVATFGASYRKESRKDAV